MNQDNKTPTTAPSDDTTSALFVSARKKQLQQQESDRIAKEKEAERLAAEAEVRRLEAEVEERRRRAEEDARRTEAEAEQRRRQADEDARRVEAEAEQRRRQADEDARRVEAEAEQRRRQADKEAKRIAVEARSKMEQAATDPDSILGARKSGTGASKKPINKMLLFVGGGVAGAVVLIVVIIIIALSLGAEEYDNGRLDTPNPSESPVVASPSPGTAASPIDITGAYFYLWGIDEADSVWFYSDGTMEILYAAIGVTETYDYTIDGDTISVHGSLYNNPAPFIFTIMSESLLIDQDGDHFERLDFAWRQTMEWTLDPYAFIDTFATIELMMLDIPFPGSELYPRSFSPDAITLSSMDDTATLSFQALFEFDWEHTEEALTEVKDDLLEHMLNATPGEAALIDDGLIHDASTTYAYFTLLYERDGEYRFTHVSVGGLLYLPVGGQWYYAISVDCLSEQIEEYIQLLENIRAEMLRMYRE